MPPRRSTRIPSHVEALLCALSALPLADQDAACRRLALDYAKSLDAGQADLSKIGRPYLDCLAALGLTPAARAALAKGGEHGAAPEGADDLARLRAERATSR